jgi:hypothetical protein
MGRNLRLSEQAVPALALFLTTQLLSGKAYTYRIYDQSAQLCDFYTDFWTPCLAKLAG